MVLAIAANSQPPVVQNPGFEASPALLGWTARFDSVRGNGRIPTVSIDQNAAKEGRQSLVIEAVRSAQASVSQRIYLPVGSMWRTKVWVKTQGLAAGDESRAGEYFRDP